MLRKILALSFFISLSSCGDLTVEPVGLRTQTDGKQVKGGIKNWIQSSNANAVQADDAVLQGDEFYTPRTSYFSDGLKTEVFYHFDTKDKKFSLITKCRYTGEDLAYISIAESSFSVKQTDKTILTFDIKNSAKKEVKMNLLKDHKAENKVCISKFDRAKFKMRVKAGAFVMESVDGLHSTSLYPIERQIVFSEQIGD